jgi:hypothetical protein
VVNIDQLLAFWTSLTRSNIAQALAVARARIAREEHVENIEGHDVQREEANTRSLIHLIHHNNMALKQQQPQLQVPPPPPPPCPRVTFLPSARQLN